jgi:CBS domain-containing protein
MMTNDRLAHEVPISAIMVRNPICLYAHESIERARALLLEHRIGGAPVVGYDDRLCGVISKTDLVRDAWLAADGGPDGDLSPDERFRLGPGFHAEHAARATVGDFMTPFAVVLPTEASVARAAALMICEGVHRIVVTDRDDRVVGIVTAIDVARWTAQRAGFLVPSPAATRAA